MKIGIITFHFSHNNGALLQCFALSEYLKSQGHDVYIIDYRPPYHAQMFVPNPNPFIMAHRAYMENEGKSLFYRAFRYIKRVFGVISHYNDHNSKVRKKQQTALEEYAGRFFQMTHTYKSIKELKKDPPECDVYISGSDQLWNPYLTDFKLDPAYFLDFGDRKIERITYAISPCLLDVKRYEKQLKEYLEKLDYISIRETEKQQELSELTDKPIEVCPDPTFLIDKEDYDSIKSDIKEKDYLLLYLMHDGKLEKNRKIIEHAVKNLGLPVIDISMEKRDWNFDFEYYGNVNTKEFLQYIRNARFVVTSSFHCTVFSTTFHKQFITIGLSGKSSRTKELLSALKLDDRFVQDEKMLDDSQTKKIEYSVVDERRKIIQNQGRSFLQEALSRKE